QILAGLQGRIVLGRRSFFLGGRRILAVGGIVGGHAERHNSEQSQRRNEHAHRGNLSQQTGRGSTFAGPRFSMMAPNGVVNGRRGTKGYSRRWPARSAGKGGFAGAVG